MTPSPAPAQEQIGTGLSIGELARRTSVEPATLRAWEQRHGFPAARRTASGHRRYDADAVAAVREVVRLRDAGVRLAQAIAQAVEQARSSGAPGTDSVFAELRRRRPELPPLRLRKSTMMGFTWAIEDECVASARRGDLFGSFQEESFFRSARDRWVEMASLAESAWAFADFADGVSERDEGLVRVPLTEASPLRREWAVVCDTSELAVALSAWEVPGPSSLPDRDRVFEAVWTVEPEAVREASRVCGRVAVKAGAPGAEDLVTRLSRRPSVQPPDAVALQRLISRALVYVDGTRP